MSGCRTKVNVLGILEDGLYFVIYGTLQCRNTLATIKSPRESCNTDIQRSNKIFSNFLIVPRMPTQTIPRRYVNRLHARYVNFRYETLPKRDIGVEENLWEYEYYVTPACRDYQKKIFIFSSTTFDDRKHRRRTILEGDQTCCKFKVRGIETTTSDNSIVFSNFLSRSSSGPVRARKAKPLIRLLLCNCYLIAQASI